MPKKVAKKSSVKKVAKRGGKQPGAGRPKGTGKYGCETKAIRIPAHLADEIVAFAQKKITAEKKNAK